MSRESVLPAPTQVTALLHDLHTQSLQQETDLKVSGGALDQLQEAGQARPQDKKRMHADLMRDKFIALEQDKSMFVYQMIRATGALNVVEAGTSYGVSTIYLATAVGQNAADLGKKVGEARVIATEHEAAKAAKAREHWHAAGDTVEPWIELREGDILETLRDVSPIDFVLFDIWTPMVVPIIKVIEPRLQPGCVILTDNTASHAEGYRDFFDYIDTHSSSYTTVTLPYSGGLELTVYRPRR